MDEVVEATAKHREAVWTLKSISEKRKQKLKIMKKTLICMRMM